MNFYELNEFWNYFYTRNPFSIFFFLFSLFPGLRALILRSSGFNSQNLPDSAHTRDGLWVGLLNSRGFFY
jgi:hypothetical protein